jgi:hypothetical protein
MPTPTARPEPGPCLYLGCDRPATHAHRSKFARTWSRGCADHHAAMREAMWIGQPATGGEVSTVKLSPACATCGAPDLEACRAGLSRFGWHPYVPDLVAE